MLLTPIYADRPLPYAAGLDLQEQTRLAVERGERGPTVILVEQKLPFARRVADRFLILDRGRLMATGEMDELDEGLVKEYLTV